MMKKKKDVKTDNAGAQDHLSKLERMHLRLQREQEAWKRLFDRIEAIQRNSPH